jgi:arginine/lysine/ornithine decarboxylase
MEKPLVDILQKLSQRKESPFYAPGHKKGFGINKSLIELLGEKVFSADLPELPELDNLFAPYSVIQKAQELAAQTFGAQETWFLVNGSTCGIIAAILATCKAGEKIILPRNCHQSAISGMILSGAVPIFVEPDYDAWWDLAYSITPQTLSNTLEKHPDIKAVLVTYPSYQGVTGDLKEIARLTHTKGIPLIVDEAHGAHFCFHSRLPDSALSLGADLVIQSTHKVLGSLTQSSMLHLQGQRVDRQKIFNSLQLLQSTSPSYLLLASLDAARAQMDKEGKFLLERTLNLAQIARSTLSKLDKISVLEKPSNSVSFKDLDLTRLTIKVTDLGLSGFSVDKWLREEENVTAELPSLSNLTFMITIGNSLEDIQALCQSFKKLVNQRKNVLPFDLPQQLPDFINESPLLSPREAFFLPTEIVKRKSCLNRISAELICPYPPGIPIIIPGQKITQSELDYLTAILQQGGIVTGCQDSNLNTFKVIAN